MKKTFAIIVWCLSVSLGAWACGPFTHLYLAEHYFTYRVCGDNMAGQDFDQNKELNRRTENCQAWAKLTSPHIPLAEIDSVVYKWDIGSIKHLLILMKQSHPSLPKNNFARWLVEHHDREIVDFLVTAKTCENTRTAQYTAWYYPVEGDACFKALSQVEEAGNRYKGHRLNDRYALQSLRAQFAAFKYQDCIDTWQRNQKHFSKGPIKDMAVDYVAGSYIRLKQNTKAVALYLKNGDTTKAHRYQKGKKENRFQWVYRHNPNSPWLLTKMQNEIHNIEWEANRYDDEYTTSSKAYHKLYLQVEKICNEKRCTDMAPWYYTLAFLADKLNNKEVALQNIRLAEDLVKQRDLAQSIRILKMWLTTKYASTYNADFESYIFGELLWLDQIIKENLTDDIRETIKEYGVQNHIIGISQYYWNDMMRKVVIGGVVPLCIRSGYSTRALQYLNMADNNIFNIVPERKETLYFNIEGTDQWETKVKIRSWEDFRLENTRTEYETNDYDYQNDLFINLDSIGVKHIINLVERMDHPLCPLDTFLLNRSYTDRQFFYDIIGTQLIASMRYKEAIPYLEKVSKRFNRSRNVYASCNHDPFTLKRWKKPDDEYRLHFAQEMYRLEQQVMQSSNPNDKAELMLRYTRGLIYSISYRNWPLTSFYYGVFYNSSLNSNYQQRLQRRIEQQAERTKQRAFKLFTDEDRAAQAYMDWKMFKTAAERYPDTKAAKLIKGKCDVLRDYHIRP